MANDTEYILAEEELSCPICFEDYEQFNKKRHPKLLLCLHTFCFECIDTLRQYNGQLQCSICRTDHNVNDMSDLLDNYIVNDYLLRKQLFEDEQYANELNEENSDVGEEPLRVTVIEDNIEHAESSDKEDQYPILEQEVHTVLSEEELCSEEGSSVQEIIDTISDNEETLLSNQSFSDAIEDSNQSSLITESPINDDSNVNSVGEESETSYNSPAESLSTIETDLTEQLEDDGHIDEHHIEEDSETFLAVEGNDIECKSSNDVTFVVEPQSLKDNGHSTDWETAEDDEPYASYEP